MKKRHPYAIKAKTIQTLKFVMDAKIEKANGAPYRPTLNFFELLNCNVDVYQL